MCLSTADRDLFARTGRCRPVLIPFIAASSMGSPTKLGPAGACAGVDSGPPGGMEGKREGGKFSGSERDWGRGGKGWEDV